MNIYLDNVNFSSSSGPNSFGRKLAKELIKLGHKIDEQDPTKIDVILTFIMYIYTCIFIINMLTIY